MLSPTATTRAKIEWEKLDSGSSTDRQKWWLKEHGIFWEWWRGATQSLILHLSKNSQIYILQHFFYKNVFSLFNKSENSHTVGETDRQKVSQDPVFTYLYLTTRRTDAKFQITDALWPCLILHSTVWFVFRKLPCNWNPQIFQEQRLFWHKYCGHRHNYENSHDPVMSTLNATSWQQWVLKHITNL